MPHTQTVYEKITDSVTIENLIGVAPNCFRFMEGKVKEYIPGRGLTVSFTARDEYLNPAMTMQGGFITAAFDNVFGPLCRLVTDTGATTTIDLNTHYHRPVFSGDEITISAVVKTKGKTKVHMHADAFDANGKLIASATTTYIHLNR